MLEKKLKDSEQELKGFKNTNRIVSLEEQKSVLLKQISDLELELAKTKSDRSESEGKLQALKKSSAGFSDDRTLGQETDFNPYSMSIIRNKVSELRLEEEKLLTSYTAAERKCHQGQKRACPGTGAACQRGKYLSQQSAGDLLAKT